MDKKETFSKKGKEYFWHHDGIIKKIKRYRVPIKIALVLDRKETQRQNKENKKVLKRTLKLRVGRISYRAIIENDINRSLLKSEIIHHIDCNKNNNIVENLLITNPSEHKKLHFQLEFLSRYLIKEKIISFDLNERAYYFNEKVRFSFL